jgi:hypothetical protein
MINEQIDNRIYLDEAYVMAFEMSLDHIVEQSEQTLETRFKDGIDEQLIIQ